jgi:hypothetical protein
LFSLGSGSVWSLVSVGMFCIGRYDIFVISQ